MRTCAYKENVAFATALGARVRKRTLCSTDCSGFKKGYMCVTMGKEIKASYYDNFACVADRCSLTCCREWKIAVDDKTYDKWKRLTPPESVKTKNETLDAFVQMKDGGRVICLEENQKCPFLNCDKLCKLVTVYGDSVLSETCQIFPREIHEFEDRKEYTLMPCCPEALELLYQQEKFEVVTVDALERSEETQQCLRLLRDKMISYVQREDVAVEESLLVLFYLLLDLWEQCGETEEEKEKLLVTSKILQEITEAVANVELPMEYTFEERNELFLDLSVNYRREGLYKEFLEPLAEEAEWISKRFSEQGESAWKSDLQEKVTEFENHMKKYNGFMKRFLASEIFADVLGEDGDLESMVVKFQWLSLEYAVIRQALFLHWLKHKDLQFEDLRDYMAVVCRMTGYEDDDIYEYLENSFESLVWDWGYFALIIGKV